MSNIILIPTRVVSNDITCTSAFNFNPSCIVGVCIAPPFAAALSGHGYKTRVLAMLLRRLLLLLRAQRHATKIAILTRAHMATVGLYLFAVAIQPLLYYAFPVPVKRTVDFARLWVASWKEETVARTITQTLFIRKKKILFFFSSFKIGLIPSPLFLFSQLFRRWTPQSFLRVYRSGKPSWEPLFNLWRIYSSDSAVHM